MEIIVDVLVEVFFDMFGEGFVSLCSAFVPQKSLSNKSQRVIGLTFLVVALALFVGLIIGIVLLVETGGQSFLGWLLVFLNVLYVFSGIVLKIISLIRK